MKKQILAPKKSALHLRKKKLIVFDTETGEKISYTNTSPFEAFVSLMSHKQEETGMSFTIIPEEATYKEKLSSGVTILYDGWKLLNYFSPYRILDKQKRIG